MSRTTTLGQGTLLGHFDANPELIPWREACLALPGKLNEAEADARARGVGAGRCSGPRRRKMRPSWLCRVSSRCRP